MMDIWEIVIDYKGWRKTFITRYRYNIGDVVKVYSDQFVPGTDTFVKCEVVSVIQRQEI